MREAIKRLAERQGCLYAGKPQISKLLERNAAGELLLVPATTALGLLKSLAVGPAPPAHPGNL
ncbi:MAG: hypothetical protein H7Y22_07705 [Gemmatimonadaceae bacterium]|nr:hypothetical protein [Gloeobacterales cyanobacterium ES-bin-141]